MAEHTVTIAHALFSYARENGSERLARRGDTITIDGEDFERGQRHGAFVDDPSQLQRHGVLDVFAMEDLDDLEQDELNDWMRSASVSDVEGAIAKAAAEGIDVTSLLLAGELNRGSEARQEVLDLLGGSSAPGTEPTTPATPADQAAVDAAERQLKDDQTAAAAAATPSELDEAALAAAAAAGDITSTSPVPPAQPLTDRIDDVLAWVDGDVTRAQVALDKERAEKGDKARPRLVTQLQETLAGATPPTSGVTS
ncbi:MAG TPA: hypothetical protein VMF51_18240 [Nocardioides sp.]|uniref:hypothetical protein n=1 Tax=Nocardioides sp. TaxID=35761 RepID=UPI002CF3A884|nr:hypothetical protein [Nocardioides sp.]HTW17076.1 hypothetical protein [Nocardioides sp.]